MAMAMAARRRGQGGESSASEEALIAKLWRSHGRTGKQSQLAASQPASQTISGSGTGTVRGWMSRWRMRGWAGLGWILAMEKLAEALALDMGLACSRGTCAGRYPRHAGLTGHAPGTSGRRVHGGATPISPNAKGRQSETHSVDVV